MQSSAGSSTAGLAASAPASRASRRSSTRRIPKQASSQHSASFCHPIHSLAVTLPHVWYHKESATLLRRCLKTDTEVVHFLAGDKPLHAVPEVPLLEHIQEMRTPAPELVLAEFRAQKGVAEPAAQPAVPEPAADEPAVEPEEAVITPRSGATHTLAAVSSHCMVWQCSHAVQAWG